MYSQPRRHEFKAVIEGIELSPEVAEEMCQAVQKAVLTELANLDLRGAIALRIPDPSNGNGGTQGIWAREITPEEAERAGIEPPGQF